MIVEKGYAKINLVLEVVGKRDDDYHNLEMVSTTIDLYDELYFTPESENRVIIECDDFANIPKETNLIYKVANYLKTNFNITTGVRIKVVKKIPMGAGLAGGSADAAATLRALNEMWDLNLSLDELAKIGLEFGSDIPFCIYNKTAIVSGRGERLEFIEDVPFGYVVMVNPRFSSSTKTIFSNYKGKLCPKGNVKKMHEAIRYSDLSLVAACLYNDLEQTVTEVYANKYNINNIKNDLINFGTFNAVMSGSGSTVYGLVLNDKQAKNVKNKFISKHKIQYNNSKVTENVYNVATYAIRSSRKSVKANIINQKEMLINEVGDVINSSSIEVVEPKFSIKETIKTKAYGRAQVSFLSDVNHFRIIEAPLNAYDDLTIQIIDKPIYKVFINNKESHSFILKDLLKIVEKFSLPDGYIISIEQHIHPSLGLVKNQTYIARIIRKLSKVYNMDVDDMFKKLHPSFTSYQFEMLYEYNRDTNRVKFLRNIPFSYVVVIPVSPKKLNDKQSRRNAINNFDEYQNVLKGLSLSDYFLTAANITNNLDDYFWSKYDKSPYKNKINIILEHIKKSKSNNYIFSFDGTNLITFFKNEKRAFDLLQRLKKINIYNVEKFSFKSNISHQSSVQAFDSNINLGHLQTSEFEPFVDEECIDDDLDEVSFDEIITDKEIDIGKMNINEEDLEGLFHIASPGSIFKQYDYVELAHFFYRYFHNVRFYLTINEKKIEIVFNINWLPHIFGLHLIDENNGQYRGHTGAQKLLLGEITYEGLKKLRNKDKITDATLDEIIKKTQSAFMVLKDLYINNLHNIECFDKNVIKRPGSKMDNLEYAITRKMAVNYHRDLNLVGIGYDKDHDNYYFYTSFLWRVHRTIKKDDSLTIKFEKKL